MTTTSTTCKPIPFKPPMVRAILAGRKTQTRGIIDPQPMHPMHGYMGTIKRGQVYALEHGPDYPDAWPDDYRLAPYQPGDLLWVRERWCRRMVEGECVYNAEGNLDPSCYYYEATDPDVVAVDGDGFHRFNKDGSASSPWKPSMHMPRSACRLWLRVEAVRVERLQEIIEADAIAEGIEGPGPGAVLPGPFDEGRGMQPGFSAMNVGTFPTAARAYAFLWDVINGLDAWKANPWVWVYTFSRAERPEGWGC